MADAQENFRGLSQRVFDAVGPNLNPRVSTTDRGEAHIMSNTLAALLDRLDEAKRLHEVERDRANDLLSDRDEALSDLDAIGDAVRPYRSLHDNAAWVTVGRVVSQHHEAIRERDEARAEVERQKSIAGDALRKWTLSKAASQIEQARANTAEARIAELEAEVERLRGEVSAASDSMRKVADLNEWLCGQRAAQPVSVGLAGLHICDAIRMEIEALDARLAWFEAEPIDSRSRAVRLDLLERIDKAQGEMVAQEVARRERAEMRVAELEKAARETVRSWSRFTDGTTPFLRAIRHLRDLVGDPDFEVREDAALPDLTNIPTWIHDLDKRVTADLNGLRERIGRVEQVASFWESVPKAGESAGSDPLDGITVVPLADSDDHGGTTVAGCHDCGRPYGDKHGFPDLVVSFDVWKRISPTGDEGGLLCPSCICKRVHDAGITSCAAGFKSGPFATTESVDVEQLWEKVWGLRDRVTALEEARNG